MLIEVVYQGSSKHYTEPNVLNAQFGASDGTSVSIRVGIKAEAELVLGQVYEVNIQPKSADSATKTEGASI